MPPKQPGVESTLQHALQAVDRRHVELLDGLAAAQVLGAMDVLGHHEPDEIGVGELVVDREADQPAQRILGRQIVQVQVGLDRAHAPVGFFEHRKVEPLLAAEVVVDHALAGAHRLGDDVDPGPCQALVRELARGDRQDVGHCPLGIVGARWSLRRDRAAAFLYRFVHLRSVEDGPVRRASVRATRSAGHEHELLGTP